MIQPTIGRIVWYYPTSEECNWWEAVSTEEMPGIVCDVKDDHTVSLMVIDKMGVPHGRTGVTLFQEEDDDPDLESGGMATWMPFQVASSKKYPVSLAPTPDAE